MPEVSTEGQAAEVLSLVWIGGASCDGCTMGALGATQPGLEDLLLGRVPDVPAMTLLHPTLALERMAIARSSSAPPLVS